MKPKIINYEQSKDKIDIKSIETFEKKNNIILPVPIKNFLLDNNGGSPKPNLLVFDNQNNYLFDNKAIISPFLDLEEIDSILSEGFFITKNLVPIAVDSGNNYICVDVDKNNYGKIYFWLHSDDSLCIFNNFDEFVNNFEESED